VTDAGTHVFWITSRAAGITALVFASAAVAAGLAIGGGSGLGAVVRGRAAQLRTLHEALSLAALAALLVHGLALLGDTYLRPSLLDVAIPFVSGYRPFWTGLGIVGAYGLAALSLSYYARARIGVARWRMLHRFIAVFWLLGVVHTLGAGTDAGRGWFVLLLIVVVLPPLSLLAIRVTAPVRSGRGAQGQAAGTLARREARRA
jgi:sulfoxide reductase heme-binding subunit YedZ